MKNLGAVILTIILAACGGGSDTSSNAGGDSTFGTSTADPVTEESSEVTDSATTPSGGSGSTSSLDVSSPDGTYLGELTATLSGDGVVPVEDSTDLVIEISGTEVKASAEGRSYEGKLEGDTISVEIPIDEESRGIVCQGKPVLVGEVENGTISGSIEQGEGECFSDTARVPVLVTGNFTVSK